MDGLSEMREKSEQALYLAKTVRDNLPSGGFIWDRACESAIKISEALAFMESEQGEQDLEAVKFRLRGPIYIEQREQRDGQVMWIVSKYGMVMDRDGYFICEPIPSSRTDDFIAATRFDTVGRAHDHARAILGTESEAVS